MTCRCSLCPFAFDSSDPLALKWPETDPADAVVDYCSTRTMVHPPPHSPGGSAIAMANARGATWCAGADRSAVNA